MSNPEDGRKTWSDTSRDMPEWLREARRAHAGAAAEEESLRQSAEPERRYVRSPAEVASFHETYAAVHKTWPNVPKQSQKRRSGWLQYGLAAGAAALIAVALVIDWSGPTQKTATAPAAEPERTVVKAERIVASSKPEAPPAPATLAPPREDLRPAATSGPAASAAASDPVGRAAPDEQRRRVQTQVIRPEARPEEAKAPEQQIAALVPEQVPLRGTENAGSAPAASPPPAPGASAPVRTLSGEEVASLLKRGEDFLNTGDYAAARLMLQRAAETGHARAAFLLASTYDPLVLQKQGAYAFAADLAKAKAWYEKARDFGSAEAPRRLEMLAQIDQ
jgi:hypothetical protein